MSDKKCCENCKHSVQVRADPLQIHQQRLCMWGPPQFQLLPTAQGTVPGFGFPMVQDNMCCSQFETNTCESKMSPASKLHCPECKNDSCIWVEDRRCYVCSLCERVVVLSPSSQ